MSAIRYTAALACGVIGFTAVPAMGQSFEIVPASEIQWGYLNPARGDKSPGAADLWGDRTKDSATGMLVRFNKGFSSPPHIHNITYRGVVIEGLMHNDDPQAEPLWMPTGSFWTQPAGENHITSADGDTNLIYLEIDSGPYLVQPSDLQFDNGERPVNLHANNLVWLGADDLSHVGAEGVEMAFLWGSNQSGQPGGTLLKLPAGFAGQLQVDSGELRAVVIQGSVSHQLDGEQEATTLEPGSYLGSQGAFKHGLFASSEALIYLRSDGKVQVNAN